VEISRFGVSQIIFFARGLSDTPDCACFAFTCSHGETLEAAIFQCHVFRCDVPEAVGRVFSTFARTFSSPSKTTVVPGPAHELSSPTNNPSRKSLSGQSGAEEGGETTDVLFEVSLELKEDDGKVRRNSCLSFQLKKNSDFT